MISVLWFVFVIFCINSAKSQVCDDTDHDCITKTANNYFGPFVNGVDNLVEASDPLRRDVIKGILFTTKYQFTNATMAGMKDCDVTVLKINRNESSFGFDLECPRIVINAEYEVKGNISVLYVEGKGNCSISCDDYVFMFNGLYEKKIGEDNKPHVHINKYNVDVDAKGRVTFDIKNLFGGDKEKSDAAHKFLNENWKAMDKLLRSPVVNSFMELFINNLNAFLKVLPVENSIIDIQ